MRLDAHGKALRPDVERIWQKDACQGQILALARAIFQAKVFAPFEVVPSHSQKQGLPSGPGKETDSPQLDASATA
jgi:hypothetical protein